MLNHTLIAAKVGDNFIPVVSSGVDGQVPEVSFEDNEGPLQPFVYVYTDEDLARGYWIAPLEHPKSGQRISINADFIKTALSIPNHGDKIMLIEGIPAKPEAGQ